MIKIKVLTLMAVMLAAPLLRGEEPMAIHLWPNGAPGFENLRDEPEMTNGNSVTHVNNPSITVYLPPPGKANGAAVLICPGGGHRALAFKSEGYEPAKYFNDLGVAAFVLKYRLARETNSPYSLDIHPRQDGQRAMRFIRNRAKVWHLDPHRVGVVGFSAGGEVASVLAYGPSAGTPDAADPIDRLDAHPDFQVVVYPGPLGIPDHVTKSAPPAFFLVASDDHGHLEPVLKLAEEYHDAKLPFELHVLEDGGHGFNMGARSKFSSVRDWPNLLTDWLKDRKVLAGH